MLKSINKLTLMIDMPHKKSQQRSPYDDEDLNTDDLALNWSLGELQLSKRVRPEHADPEQGAYNASERQSYSGRTRDEPQESAFSRRVATWAVVEGIAAHLDQEDWPNFARSCRAHYSIAQAFLWPKPVLTIKQAQLFLNGIYRRPVVSDLALRVGEDNLKCQERPDTVSHLTFDFTRLGLEMFEVCESAVMRIRTFCPKTYIEVHVTAGTALSDLWVVQKAVLDHAINVVVEERRVRTVLG